MTIYLVRHAKAGSRSSWEGPDEDRPLSKNGRRQTKQLTASLAQSPVSRVLTSPYVRCIQTVEPLATALGIPVEPCDSLAEGTPCADAVDLLEKYSGEDAVLCSHGDVIGDLLDECGRRGVGIGEGGLEKGSVWVLEFDAGQVSSARYIPSPR